MFSEEARDEAVVARRTVVRGGDGLDVRWQQAVREEEALRARALQQRERSDDGMSERPLRRVDRRRQDLVVQHPGD